MASKPKMTLNQDWRDMLSALSDAGAKYMIIGGYAVVMHGIARMTKDLDIWVDNTPDNAERVWKALRDFGTPMMNLKRADLEKTDTVFQIGMPPRRVDLLTGVAGATFEEAYKNRCIRKFDDDEVVCIGREDLIKIKLAAGRLRDRSDAKRLQKQEENRGKRS